jgi:hypothetical protein
MLQGDEKARVAVERFYRTEGPEETTTEAVWATSTKAYVFAVTRRVEERAGRVVPVHRGERVSWRVLLAYDKPRAGDPEPRERESFEAAFAALRELFHDVY